jgi:hypothetical protein
MPKKKSMTSAAMMASLRTMIVAEESTGETRLRALELAYEIGKAAGHFDGAVKMAEGLTADFAKNLDKMFTSP